MRFSLHFVYTILVIFIKSLLVFHLQFSVSYAQTILNQPESVVYDTLNKRYLVSNYGDGSIVQIDRINEYSYFATGLQRCVGLHIVENKLYIACAEHGLKGFDLTYGDSPELIMDLTIPGMHFLNDITSDSSGNLYVTDFFEGGCKIYKISTYDHSYSIFLDSGLTWTNGIFCNEKNNRLITVGYIGNDYTRNYIACINLENSMITDIIDPGIPGLDGITRDNEGNIYVSAWVSDAIYKFIGGVFNSPPELFSSGHTDPADIFYNPQDSTLVIPNFNSNTLSFIKYTNHSDK